MSDTISKGHQTSTTNDSVTRDQVLSLPVELHEYISVFLGTSSILNLIKVNHDLRPIYEAILYRRINLASMPNRSISLLETLKLRPDLALLVHTLNINLQPSVIGTLSQTQSACPGYARIQALGQARNIRSLGIFGLSWLPDEKLHAVQEAISRMELKTLRIKEPEPSSAVTYLDRKEEVIANLRRVLQSQPSLQDLDLEFRLFRMEVKNGGGDVQFGIQKSDVPGLRTLGIRASTLIPFLKAIGSGGQLESLGVYEWKQKYHDTVVSSLSRLPETSAKVRRLRVSMRWTWPRGWGFEFSQVLESFPNVESLTITAILSPFLAHEPKILEAYLIKLASQVPHSPKILKIEICLEISVKPRRICVADIGETVKDCLKKSCPSLEVLVDPARQEWRFCPVGGEGKSDTFRAIKMGRLHAPAVYCPSKDLFVHEQGSQAAIALE